MKLVYQPYHFVRRLARLTGKELNYTSMLTGNKCFILAVFIFLTFCFACLSGNGQEIKVSSLKSQIQLINNFNKRLPVEKLYLQFDKPYYLTNDTIRFKVYLLNADFLTPSTRSGLLYVELDDAANRCVKRVMAPVAFGIGWGDIALDEKEIPAGSYTLRAYTNWMRNFGEDYILKKDIYISPSNAGSTLINTGFKLESGTDKDKVTANLQFTGMSKEPARLKDIQLQVMNGKHNLYKEKATTDMDGIVAISFDLADKTATRNLTIKAQATGKGADTAMLTIPVTINRPENTDLQFMPEGGSMVAGIPARVGFKAISEDGKGTDVSGKIYNSKQREIATLQSIHAGMGSFGLTPQAGESYTVKVTLPGGSTKSYPLPVVKPSGTVLNVRSKGDDSLEVTISSTADLLASNGPSHPAYYLIGQSRGVVCYAAAIGFKDAVFKSVIAKVLFPTGIVHFTLLNAQQIALNERLTYIDHDDNLRVNIAANKADYTIRDSVALTLNVKDKDGKPIRGDFSMAVTDDSQVRIDSAADNILNNLLLTSDLKGTIEEPGWYFEDGKVKRAAELDNLLLTQGWVGYDWKQVFDPQQQKNQYDAEPEFVVSGVVKNILNKPAAGTTVALYSRKPFLVKDTVTDKNGRFVFKRIFPVDTAAFKIQALNKHGSTSSTSIEMVEFKPPVFSGNIRQQTPWYVNSDAVLLNNSNTKVAQLKAEADYRGEGHLLKDVNISEKKIVKDSKNLNGPGEADQVLDEHDMEKAGKMTLGELLEKNIKGFKVYGIAYLNPAWKGFGTSYVLTDKVIHLVFDGVDANRFYDGSDIGPLYDPVRYNFIKFYMDYYTAEDIKGIEVMYSNRYNSNYIFMNNTRASMVDFAYIEITTRSGKGPFMKTTPGTYLYKPLPFTLPKQFYRPRYTAKNNIVAMGSDLRSTIHWEPNIITDTAGKAIVTFYTADKPAAYTIIIEGTDLKGNIGYYRKKIKIVQ